MKLVFATHNQNKYNEVNELLPQNIELLSLDQISCFDEIDETADTLRGNALLKSQHIKENFGHDCFADDTGLFVEALDGAPGIFSARYAGNQKDAMANMEKLLNELSGKTNKRAYFQTSIALIWKGATYFFDGRVDGQINTDKKGDKGFGYDPIFLPNGHSKTFAELPLQTKNTIGHRGQATRQLIDFLTKASNSQE